MTEQPAHRPAVDPARAFDLVADAYDRGRPGYPDEAVAAVVEGAGRAGADLDVVEVGAGTGKLTEQLLAHGCRVTATDPSGPMLARLRERSPQAVAVRGSAERLPVRSRSADVVVAAQAFGWFDAADALAEAVRVLRPGGRLAVLWSTPDERIPWVRRLDRLVGGPERPGDPTEAIDESAAFEAVDRRTFRFWQPLGPGSVRDLAVSRAHVALMSDRERERLLRKVDELYEEYGRGHDGMLLPYMTTVCRTTLLPWAVTEEVPDDPPTETPAATDDSLLIDFR